MEPKYNDENYQPDPFPEDCAQPSPAPTQYRKVIRTEPPALIRLAPMGWRQPCGHHAYEWSDRIHDCLACVRENRKHPPHWTVPWFVAMSPAERKALLENWKAAIENRGER